MADREPPADNHSLQPDGFGMGQNADGTFNIFPASELPARSAAQREEEAAWMAAIEQSEEDPSDISDLDELDANPT